MGKRLSELAQIWASKYPAEARESFGVTYAMGGLMAIELIQEVLDSQRNLISQIAWDRIQESIHEIKS